MSKREELKFKTFKDYNVLQAAKDKLFDSMAMLAAKGCDKPFAIVSFIDSETQLIASQVGTFPNKINHEDSICAHTIKQTGVLEIPDTLLDERTNQNKFVVNAPNVRFYAGIPLIDKEKQILGTLCVLDNKPNTLDASQKFILEVLAKDVVSQLEISKKNNALNKLKELYELITENNSDLIFVKDDNFKIVHANSAFLALYPEEVRDKVIGYTTVEKYNDDEAEAFLAQDKLAFELGKTETMEKIAFPNSEIRTLLTTKTRFKDNDDMPYILGVSRDVTEREDLIQMLKKSNSDLNDFAYVASHDLKAPLNAIKKLVSWIEEDMNDALQGDSLEHFGMIKNRIDRMNMLLKDLLLYSRVGKKDGTPQKLNLRETANHCYELLDLTTGFTIEVDNVDIVLPKLPLELILTNLMSNSIKHHHKKTGHIKIELKHLKHDYQISVTDDGPGIAPSFHEKIFEKFQTLKPRDEVEGSGLGLAMVEKALANYSGKISLNSDVNKGTSFIIKWPKPGSSIS